MTRSSSTAQPSASVGRRQTRRKNIPGQQVNIDLVTDLLPDSCRFLRSSSRVREECDHGREADCSPSLPPAGPPFAGPWSAGTGWRRCAGRLAGGRPCSGAGERDPADGRSRPRCRSEEHTSELQSLMRLSYAVFCLNKKTTYLDTINNA